MQGEISLIKYNKLLVTLDALNHWTLYTVFEANGNLNKIKSWFTSLGSNFARKRKISFGNRIATKLNEDIIMVKEAHDLKKSVLYHSPSSLVDYPPNNCFGSHRNTYLCKLKILYLWVIKLVFNWLISHNCYI